MANKMLFGYNFGKLSVAVIPVHQDKADRGDWVELDPATLTDDLADKYQSYKDAYRLAKDEREAFESAMRDAAGILQHGKPQSTAGKSAQSLSAFLASANGRNV